MSFLEYMDWITPTKSLIGRALGKTDTIIVPESKSAWAIGVMMDARIEIKNPSFVGDKFAFDVDANKAELARRLLGD